MIPQNLILCSVVGSKMLLLSNQLHTKDKNENLLGAII